MFVKNSKYKTMTIPCEIKSEDVNEDGTFSGWGSVFGGAPDSYGDIVVKGAFKNTLKNGGRNGNGVAMLYQHNASDPIGIWTHLEEKTKGLWVEGQIALDVQKGKEAYALMKMGALKGLSIGYDFPRDEQGKVKQGAYEVVEKPGERTIWKLKELDLWEISPVTFPANTRANIVTVKDVQGCATERELEAVLRDSGLSNRAAQYIVSLCRKSLRDSEEEIQVVQETEAEAILSALRERREAFADF